MEETILRHTSRSEDNMSIAKGRPCTMDHGPAGETGHSVRIIDY
jgi:hypothetical protein